MEVTCMQIVVLDGFTLNPGDLSWEALSASGTWTIHDRTAQEDILPRAQDAQSLLTNKTPLSRDTIAALPRLRYIGVLATGYNIVDVDAARERGIPVTNVPAYSTMSVAQVVFAHLFNLTHRMSHHTIAVREGAWTVCKDFSFADAPLVEVSGLTMGIIGLGRIGTAVARAATAFGMNVLAHDPSHTGDIPRGVRMTSLDEVFALCDVLTLHCPLTPSTRGIVNRERLAMMKPTSFLINTSRGPLVDEDALAETLNAGAIAGAGLDVLSLEPPPADNPLLREMNCFITPHFAWASTAARRRLITEVAENLAAFTRGERRNVVN
jgi:glycerate dehydrogenase